MRKVKHKGQGQSGFSLVELIIALTMMSIALLALMSSVFSSSRLVDASRERTIAYGAARAKIEEMRTYTICGQFNGLTNTAAVPPLENIFEYYKKAANKTATVSGLNPILVLGVAQPHLTISFPTDATGLNLSENPAATAVNPAVVILATALGMPKDLNRDGDILDVGSGAGTAASLNTNYNILPVLVKVQWRSAGGGSTAQSLELTTYITEK